MPEFARVKEALKQSIHVACCAMIHQANEAGFFPTIVVRGHLNTVCLSNAAASSKA